VAHRFVLDAILGSKGASKITQVIRARSARGARFLDGAAKLRAATVGKATGYATRSEPVATDGTPSF
jgi:hypothetical protein